MSRVFCPFSGNLWHGICTLIYDLNLKKNAMYIDWKSTTGRTAVVLHLRKAEDLDKFDYPLLGFAKDPSRKVIFFTTFNMDIARALVSQMSLYVNYDLKPIYFESIFPII